MALSIYKKDNVFWLNGAIVPTNTYRCVIELINGVDTITIENVSEKNHLISRVPITSIGKEVGFYANIAEFITDCAVLFSVVPANSGVQGATETTLAKGLQFKKNGAVLQVTEDTTTPSNNIPLPVKLTSVTGDVIINAGDLSVDITAYGVNYSSVRLSDGVKELGITANNEAKVLDSTTHTKLDTLNSKDFSTGAKQDDQTYYLSNIKDNTTNISDNTGYIYGEVAQVNINQTSGNQKTQIVNVSGTVLDSSTLATSTKQTDGTQLTRIVDADGHQVNVQKIDVPFDGSEYGATTNSIIHGQSTTNGAKWVDVKVNNYGNLMTAFDPIQLDSFGRLRIGAPAFRFDGQLTYQINNDTFDSKTTGGSIAHDATNRMALLTANAGAANSAILQSHYHPPYTPGRGHLALLTFNFISTPTTGGDKRVGLFGETNGYGIYLQQTPTAINLVLAGGTSNGTQTVSKTNWNIDKLDGTGVSGYTLDLTKVQILVIQYQALYVGRVTVAFDINGDIVPVHSFNHANLIAYPYIQQASLPIHFSVRTSSLAQTMNAICASVISEGGMDLFLLQGRTFAASNGITSITVTTRRPILTIRCKQQLNSINQNSVTIPIEFEVSATGNSAYIELVRNGTLTGTPAFTNVDTANSVMESDVAATGITGGTVISANFANVSAGGASRTSNESGIGGKVVLAYSHLLGVGDTLTVVATSFTGNAVLSSLLKWKEIR